MNNSTRKALSILAADVGGIPFGVGAVYFTDQALPHQMTKVKQFVADHIVLPHMETFDKLAKGLRSAHDNYDKRKRDALANAGIVVPEEVEVPLTPREHAYNIADVLVRASVGLTGDFAATYSLQKVIQKAMNIHNAHPFKNTVADAGVTLLAIIAMPLAAPRTSENIHNGLRKKIRDIMGISNDKADDIALPLTYVSLPSLFGVSASLGVDHMIGRGK